MPRIAKRTQHALSFEKLEPRTVLSAAPIITEFVASNDGSLRDGDGNTSDWIEIYNPTSQTINLAGWHLTDRANNLDKWTFPNAPQSILSPGEYLIVFASSQPTETYIDPLGYLHTDFALSADGEFLGLTDPSENIIWSYAPLFPQQLADVSYGVKPTSVELIGNSTITSAWVPTSGVHDAGASPAWTQIAFNDAAWSHSTTGPGVGFDSSAGHVAGPANGIKLGGLVGNDLTDPENDATLAVSFVGGSSSNSPSGEEPARALDSLTSTKWLAFAPLGTFYQMQFLDGVPRTVDRYTITSANDAAERDPYSWTLSGSNDGTNFTVIDTRNAQDFATRFETRQYDFVNTTGYTYYKFDFQTEYGVTGNNQPVAIQMAEIELLSSQTLNMDTLVDLDLEAAWQATRSSVYQRVDFNIADPAQLGALSLDMQYNDGFVAYLNGTKVASSNAPASTNWQSNALGERDDSLAFAPERFDLSAYHHLLVPGQNVLAIQVLNDGDSSDDLLSRPRLTAAALTDNPLTAYYFETPTPGAPNGEGRFGFVQPPTFSVPHGFYTGSFQLTINSATPGAAIYYTTGGDAPTPANGTLYTSSITIDHNTVVSAAAYLEGYYDSSAVSSSYLFLNDVVRQNYVATLAEGFPATWGPYTPDYGMDPDVIGNFNSAGNPTGGDLFGGQYAATIMNDLLAIPTLSLVMDIDDMFGPNGIYTNSTNGGIAYERATSVELIHPDGTQGFQINAGIRIQGGAFRNDSLSKKHSLRLLFKEEYGATKLEYPFFGADAVDRFDTITLRMESNDGYAWDGAGTKPQYARDAFASRTLLEMGQVASHGNRVHLYINGVYWGVYNPVERPDASFAAMYFGGDKDNWDAINDGSPTDGDLDAWNVMVAIAQAAGSGSPSAQAAYQQLQGNNPDGTDNPAYEDYLDIDNYIDYLMVNFFVGNVDWPHRNWYAVRERGIDSTGFKFVSWDAESGMNLFGSNVNTNRLDANVEAAEAYSYLRNNPEFRLAFADHAHKALFNNGVLTTQNTIDRYEAALAEMEQAIVAESARWGDMHRSTPLTKAQWTAEGQSVINTFLNSRSAVFLNQLKNANLYPSTSAPAFSQHGGTAPATGLPITITGSGGTIYYTLDGSDPRALGGAAVGQVYRSAVTVTPGTTLKARVLSGGVWSALNEATYEAVALAGDYNGDSTVDHLDYALWKSDFGATNSPADGNGDGVVNLADYTIWRDNLGATAVVAITAPSAITTPSVIAPASLIIDATPTTSELDAPAAPAVASETPTATHSGILPSPTTPSLLTPKNASSASDQAVEQLLAAPLASALELLLDLQAGDEVSIDFSDPRELDDMGLVAAGSFALEFDAALEDDWQGL